MLKRKDISVTQRDDLKVDRIEITASTTLQSRYQIDRFAMRACRSGEVIAHVKEEVVRHLWHHCYGDLIRPSRELMHLARLGSRFEDVARVDELCKQLNGMLAVPQE